MDRFRSTDQMRTAAPTGGNGSAKPIQNTDSTGSNARPSTAPLRRLRHSKSTRDTLGGADPDECRQQRDTGPNSQPLERALTVGWEPHETGDRASAGEVRDTVDTRQPEPEARHPAHD